MKALKLLEKGQLEVESHKGRSRRLLIIGGMVRWLGALGVAFCLVGTAVSAADGRTRNAALLETLAALEGAVYLCDMPAVYRLTVNKPDATRLNQLTNDCLTAQRLRFSISETERLGGMAHLFGSLVQALQLAKESAPQINGDVATYSMTLPDGRPVRLRFVWRDGRWAVTNL